VARRTSASATATGSNRMSDVEPDVPGNLVRVWGVRLGTERISLESGGLASKIYREAVHCLALLAKHLCGQTRDRAGIQAAREQHTPRTSATSCRRTVSSSRYERGSQLPRCRRVLALPPPVSVFAQAERSR